MKRLTSGFLVIVMVLTVFALAMPMCAAAASANVVGFPLPAKSTPYSVNVLSHYSSGAVHMPYMYEWGPLKGYATNLNIVMDIGVAQGTEVYSVADGTVRTVKYGNGGGHYIVIDHGGTYSYYGHLRERSFLNKGEKVVAGQLIGYSGNTGNSTGAHLHFEWSGHDPYCLYEANGLVKISNSKSGAGVYPHTHTNPYKQQSQSNAYNQQTSCSHKYTGGICNKCGYEYGYKVTAINATAYKITKNDGAPVWSRPYSNKSERLGTIAKGSYVVATAKTVNQAGNVWLRLTDKSWVYAGNVQACSMPKNVRYVKNGGGLNIRSAANTSGRLLATIPNGGMIIVDPSKTSGSWIYASYPAKGVYGWLSKNYITSTAP